MAENANYPIGKMEIHLKDRAQFTYLSLCAKKLREHNLQANKLQFSAVGL